MRLRHACVYYKERNDEYQLQQQQQQQKVTTAIAQPTNQPRQFLVWVKLQRHLYINTLSFPTVNTRIK